MRTSRPVYPSSQDMGSNVRSETPSRVNLYSCRPTRWWRLPHSWVQASVGANARGKTSEGATLADVMVQAQKKPQTLLGKTQIRRISWLRLVPRCEERAGQGCRGPGARRP